MFSCRKILFACCFAGLLAGKGFSQPKSGEGINEFPGQFILHSDPAIRYSFGGFAGERIQAMVDGWLLPAPGANPGMLEMFRVRDRQPKPNLVPWAGEFVGKYLISAVQTLRMTENPALRNTIAAVVQELISTQAEDGYLGPFTKAERLRGHWDLWGHYHCMLGLLMWHEGTGEAAALQCAKKAADLVCSTYLDSGRRALEAGSDEMNLAVSHSLGWLYRLTKEPRYLRMVNEIEKDWERAGDYFRKGLEGVEFYQTPRPRWESLHNIQALVELYQIKGDARYREAFEHHWRSIARFDLRNSGGFSSGEQATGNPYAPTAIETCCTIAWMCLSVDMLKLNGDSRVADYLELATFNAWAGAQHPSGRWCTYSTPMDGARLASAHEIVFQSRPGTPELNCCSVNGPRGWSMLSDWATMKAKDGLVQNWLAPGSAELQLSSGNRVKLRTTGNYPVEPATTVTLEPQQAEEFTLSIRIPEWSKTTTVTVNNGRPSQPKAGSYFKVRRTWRNGDKITLAFDFGTRVVPGDREARGNVSLYRGPLLLAWDQRYDTNHEESTLPVLDVASLRADNSVQGAARASVSEGSRPLLLLEVTDRSGATLPVCDFASAGASGTRYRSWLPATNAPTPQASTRLPRDGATIARGQVLFRHKPDSGKHSTARRLEISDREDDFSKPLLTISNLAREGTLVKIDERFQAGKWFYWRVVSAQDPATVPNFTLPARFRVDPRLPVTNAVVQTIVAGGPNGELVASPSGSFPKPIFGKWLESQAWKPLPAPDQPGVQLDGAGQKLLYQLEQWPEEDYSLTVSFRVDQLPRNRLGQIFSAWCRGSDDPLRLVVDGGKLFARVEAGQAFSTEGIPITANQWHTASVVKEGSTLTLYLDGRKRSSAFVPEAIHTQAKDFALGGNPHYHGNEHLAVSLKQCLFYGRALSEEEIRAAAGKTGPQ